MKTKICTICGKEKNITNFRFKTIKSKDYSYYYNFCKECERKKNNNYQKKYNEQHKEHIQEYNKQKYLRNKNVIDNRNKIYCEKNKDKIKQYKEKNKEKIKEYRHKYYIENKEKEQNYFKEYYQNNFDTIAQKNKEYKADKRKKDKIYAFKEQIRNMIYNSFKRKNMKKNKKAEEILGCSIGYFINYLLQTFKDNYGYEWDRKEEVHIDHKTPLIIANTKDEVVNLCNYKNLQLLKASDNLSKSCKITQ